LATPNPVARSIGTAPRALDIANVWFEEQRSEAGIYVEVKKKAKILEEPL